MRTEHSLKGFRILMKVEFSKKTKLLGCLFLVLVGVAAGLILEKYDPAEFTIKPFDLPESTPEIREVYDSAYDENGRLDINAASVKELMTLNGIGEAMATKIVEYREKHGLYDAVEELTLVSGIGPKKLEGIKDKICVR